MLSPLQKQILQQVENKWSQYSGMRFGQLISNMLSEKGNDIFYIPDNIAINMVAGYPKGECYDNHR